MELNREIPGIKQRTIEHSPGMTLKLGASVLVLFGVALFAGLHGNESSLPDVPTNISQPN